MEIQYNINMKVIKIKHEELFTSITDMLYDFVYLDNEPLNLFASWLDDLTTPERFTYAVTTDCKAFTYFNHQLDSMKDLDMLASEYDTTKEDFVIVVCKGDTPWCSILFSQLRW